MPPLSSSQRTVVIADDEPIARRGLKRLIVAEPGLVVVAECATGEETLRAVRELRPDLLFLDVQMPPPTGVELLRVLGDQKPKAVVFVTAFDRFAVDAFEYSAVDYLLKPFGVRRFRVALERARERLRPVEPSRREWLTRLPARLGARVAVVQANEIQWLEAADNYIWIHVRGQRHLLRGPLTDLEAKLDPGTFVRVHRSAMVNLAFVKELRALPTGSYAVALTSGLTVPMSRRYRQQVAARLGLSLG